MQNVKSKLVILFCVSFIFLVIFSSTTMVGTAINPPLVPQNINNNAIETKTLENKSSALVGSKSVNPNNLTGLTSKGLALVNLGKYNESITYFDKALAIKPNDTGALASKGLALARLGKYNDSITFYDKALAINPKYTVAIFEKEYVLKLAAQKANSTNTNSTSANSTSANSTTVKH